MLMVPQNSLQQVRLVRNRIETATRDAGRSVDSVTLLAVSKGQSANSIRAVAEAGVRDIGESYLQEALGKIEELKDLPVTWHFIGRLQANKTRSVAEQFAWVHAVDRFKIAERLDAQRPFHAPPLNVCLQLHVGGEDQQARQLLAACGNTVFRRLLHRIDGIGAGACQTDDLGPRTLRP